MAIVFENPKNGYREERSSPWLWCLLFGFIYFAYVGVWRHAVVAFLLCGPTFGFSWLIYPLFADDIVRNHYLRQGWTEVK
jgi:asparagine N-glycosylation enzyme membrane subunit Stt3